MSGRTRTELCGCFRGSSGLGRELDALDGVGIDPDPIELGLLSPITYVAIPDLSILQVQLGGAAGPIRRAHERPSIDELSALQIHDHKICVPKRKEPNVLAAFEIDTHLQCVTFERYGAVEPSEDQPEPRRHQIERGCNADRNRLRISDQASQGRDIGVDPVPEYSGWPKHQERQQQDPEERLQIRKATLVTDGVE